MQVNCSFGGGDLLCIHIQGHTLGRAFGADGCGYEKNGDKHGYEFPVRSERDLYC